MRESNPKPLVNWPYIVFVLVVSVTVLGALAWNITAQFYREWSHGLPTHGWSWSAVVALDSGCLAMLLALGGQIFRDANTTMGEAELYQARLFGSPRTIRWTDVKSVKRVGFGIHVLSDAEKIVLTPYAYSNPAMVMAHVRSRIEHARGYLDSVT